jgi:arylsulfatase A-like enzyme
VFRNTSTPAPFTMPAMAALLTGAYPDRCGVVEHQPGVSLRSFGGEVLAESASRAGLRTAAVVANPWLGRKATGFDRGFGTFRRLAGGDRASTSKAPATAASSNSATAVTDEAIRLLRGLDGQRFLLWAHYFDPHMPYEPPAAYAEAAGAHSGPSRIMQDFSASGRDLRGIYSASGYQPAEIEQARRLYDGEVRFVDHEVGRLLDTLETTGRASDTIVVLVSDHGESLGEHGLFFAHDYDLYEELTHVALMMRGPRIVAGARAGAVSLLDVAPTICRLAGFDCAAGADGLDLFAAGAGVSSERTLFAAGAPTHATKSPFPRLNVPGLEGRWTMVSRGAERLLRIPTADGIAYEMYDLGTDPGEFHDTTARPASPSQTALAESLAAWTARMNDLRPAVSNKVARRKRDRAESDLRSLGYLQ